MEWNGQGGEGGCDGGKQEEWLMLNKRVKYTVFFYTN